MEKIFETKDFTFCINRDFEDVKESENNGMIHLSLDLYLYQESEDYKNDKNVVKELGITYDKFIPQSITDSFWYLNCENVPDELPEYLKVIKMTDEQYNHWIR